MQRHAKVYQSKIQEMTYIRSNLYRSFPNKFEKQTAGDNADIIRRVAMRRKLR